VLDKPVGMVPGEMPGQRFEWARMKHLLAEFPMPYDPQDLLEKIAEHLSEHFDGVTAEVGNGELMVSIGLKVIWIDENGDLTGSSNNGLPPGIQG
jgi:hypothetical protein